MPTTCRPSASRRCVTWKPMKPAAPVTRTGLSAMVTPLRPPQFDRSRLTGAVELHLDVEHEPFAVAEQPLDHAPTARDVGLMRDRKHHGIRRTQVIERGQRDAIFLLDPC